MHMPLERIGYAKAFPSISSLASFVQTLLQERFRNRRPRTDDFVKKDFDSDPNHETAEGMARPEFLLDNQWQSCAFDVTNRVIHLAFRARRRTPEPGLH